MVKFSAPEQRAVKAVLISKNQKFAYKIFYLFGLILSATLIYGAIASAVNGYYTVTELFNDYLFTGLTCFSVFSLSVGVYFVYKPISERQLIDNGGYTVECFQDGFSVCFPQEDPVFVPFSQVDSVCSYDLFYLVKIYGGKDEIVCSKNAFEVGDEKGFLKILKQNGITVANALKTRVYFSLINKVSQNNRRGVASMFNALIACVIFYPCLWLVIEVLVSYVPHLMSQMLLFLLDVSALARILIGFLILPIGIVATIVSLITTVTAVAFPVLLVFLSFKNAIKQLEIKKNAFSVATMVCACISIAVGVLALLSLLSII